MLCLHPNLTLNLILLTKQLGQNCPPRYKNMRSPCPPHHTLVSQPFLLVLSSSAVPLRLHISPLRRFLNTSCTPIKKKKSSALFPPSGHQSVPLAPGRVARGLNAARAAISHGGPRATPAWVRGEAREERRYANEILIWGGAERAPSITPL